MRGTKDGSKWYNNAFPDEDSFGISFREWLAGMALMGLCHHNETPEHTAIAAVQMADAVIEKLKEPPGGVKETK